MTTVTLSTGEEVDSSAPAWRQECLARSRHVETLLHMTGPGSRDQRARYIATVAEREGAESARRLKAAFVAAWDARSAKGTA